MIKQNGFLRKENGQYQIIASTGEVDRDGEIVLPSAYQKSLPRYLKTNPVILGFHNYKDFPIGKAVGGKITSNALQLEIEFADTEKGREAQYLYDGGFMSAFSVGFMPIKHEQSADGKHVIFTDVELLEVSAVPVPSNRASVIVREAKSRGVYLPTVEKIAKGEDYSFDEFFADLTEDAEETADLIEFYNARNGLDDEIDEDIARHLTRLERAIEAYQLKLAREMSTINKLEFVE